MGTEITGAPSSGWLEDLRRKILERLNPTPKVAEEVGHLPWSEGIACIAVGKSALSMLEGVKQSGVPVQAGLVIYPTNQTRPLIPDPRIAFFPANHPFPLEASFGAGNALWNFVETLAAGTPLVVLISGGASALASCPIDGLREKNKTLVHSVLVQSGFGISEINTVRRHLSRLKGGGLLRLTQEKNCPVRVFSISDVSGDFPHDIGSGPFSPDPTTFGRAFELVADIPEFPKEAYYILKEGVDGKRPETLKPEEIREGMWDYKVIFPQGIGAEKALSVLLDLGQPGQVWTEPLKGPPGKWCDRFLGELEKREFPKDLWMIARGEAEVPLPAGVSLAELGRGGRVSTLLLELGKRLKEKNVLFDLCGIATDSVDGTSGQGGGFLSAEDLDDQKLLVLERQLVNFNSAGFLDMFGKSFGRRDTGTNVGDLLLVRLRNI